MTAKQVSLRLYDCQQVVGVWPRVKVASPRLVRTTLLAVSEVGLAQTIVAVGEVAFSGSRRGRRGESSLFE
ncbi:hypothetical protein NL676_010564 [Syzygium grande]|nr:hypothetical protein NL676_010564 [Syzygium grande]